MFPGFLHAGTGKDIMKMGEQYILPCFLHPVLFKPEACGFSRQRRHGFRIQQGGLQPSVASLDTALCRITARRKIIQLFLHHRHLITYRLGFEEIFPHRTELDCRIYFPVHHFHGPFHIASCRAAAVITHSINDEAGFQPGRPAGYLNESCPYMGSNRAVIPVGLPVCEHFVSGGCLIAVQNLFSFVAAAVVIVFHPAEAVDFRHISAVSEGVWRKVDIKILHSPYLGQIFLRIPDMAEQGFSVRHILVGFHPGCCCHFPPPLRDPFLDFFHQIRIIFFHNFVNGSL